MMSDDRAVCGVKDDELLLWLADVVVVVVLVVDVEELAEEEEEAEELFEEEDEVSLLLPANSETMDVGDVEEELEEVVEEDEECWLDAIELLRMVEEVTEVGGVPAAERSDEDECGEPPATRCAPNWLVMSCVDCWQLLLLNCCCK